jgi:hypothetical protein
MRRPAVILASALAILGVACVTGVSAIQAMTPLESGGMFGPDSNTADSSWVRSETEDGPDGEREIDLYCTRVARDGAWALALANPNPLPVTLLGLSPAATGPAAADPTAGIVLRDLARFRPLTADGNIDYSAFTDPLTAPPISPIEIAPHGDVEVWVRFGLPVLEPDFRLTLEVIPLRVRIAGIERTFDLPLTSGTMAADGAACSGGASR